MSLASGVAGIVVVTRVWTCYIPGVCGVLATLFLVVPAIEIYLIITVGSALGALPTLAIVAATAIIGATLARSQGFAVLQNLRESLRSGQGGVSALIEGALVLAAGVTLLAPGFVTDAVGLALLLPPVRAAVAERIASRVQVVDNMVPMGFGGFQDGGEDDEDAPPPGVIDV